MSLGLQAPDYKARASGSNPVAPILRQDENPGEVNYLQLICVEAVEICDEAVLFDASSRGAASRTT